MAPSFVTIDTSDDFDFSPAPASSSSSSKKQNGHTGCRTLLLAPPSIASHEEKLRVAFSAYDRAVTDLQMLDRLSAGLVTLPPATYDLVLLLTDTDGARHTEALQLLSRDVFSYLVPAMKAGAKLQSQDGNLHASEAREAVLAGLVEGDGGFQKPEYEEEVVVPLRFGAKKKNNGALNGAAKTNGNGAHSSAGPAVGSVTVPINGRPTTLDMAPPAVKPIGVGFVDFSDDFGDDYDDDDDELIDEDTLMTDADLARPIQQPPECQPKPGQKRRACKDCTCGLAERLEAQDKARRDKADKDLSTLKLKSADLNELDFTVQGKTGSCGSCALGDAFRCADCPYIGLPPFKPGEEVKILNNVAQF